MISTKLIFLNKIYEHKKKIIFVINFIIIFFIFNIIILYNSKNDLNNDDESKNNNNKIIEENFFVFFSNNLEFIQSHLYGFSVSKNGILTDNYYKEKGEYNLPEPQGAFVMIRKIGKEIIVNQDYCGCYGLYIYENKESNYFALSNSFLLLEEYLIDKQILSFNKDYANNFLTTNLISFSLEETLIKEIQQIPNNAFIVINQEKKAFKIFYIDYKENTVPLESEEGLKLIDKWVDKWGYIIRSLRSKTDNISFHLSGGFDTRTLLAILLNSGINLNNINIFSLQDKAHGHEVDFEIARKISSKYGFTLNNYNLNVNGTLLPLKDLLLNSLYSKLGFHKEFYFNDRFYSKPLFTFAGGNGEALRGMPNTQINNFIKYLCYNNISGYKTEFYKSSLRIIKRSLYFLKNGKTFKNDFEISSGLYSKAYGRNHFGKSNVERFTSNIFTIQPLMDPDIRKIKLNMSEKYPHELIAFIYIRFGHDLINFPFQKKRKLNLKSIKIAKKLNNKYPPYFIKSDYNKNFFIDEKRISPSFSSKNDKNMIGFLTQLFKSNDFIKILNKNYNNNVLNWAEEYRKISDYFPFRHYYSLLAIAITLENLSLNEKFAKTNTKINKLKKYNFIEDLSF